MFDAVTGMQLRKLLPTVSLGGIQFGISVATDNGLVLVAARGSRPNGINTGVTYLFDAATGKQLAQFLASDCAAFDNFGFSVAIDNGLAIVGAHGGQSGSAYIFDVTTYQQIAKVTERFRELPFSSKPFFIHACSTSDLSSKFRSEARSPR